MTQQSRVSWLSSLGDYGVLARNLTALDPRLIQRDPKAVRQGSPWERAVARAVVLRKPQGGQFSSPLSFVDAQSLSDFLSNDVLSRDPDAQQVIIVQGLNPKFTGAIGSHFKMHPSFFVEHERVVVIASRDAGDGDGPVLPSMMTAREHVTLKYYESFTMPEHVLGMFRICCADSGRHIAATRLAGQFSRAGILRRKCSVWRRRRQGGKGWDVVVLTDPPLREVRQTPTSPPIRVTPIPLQGGYVDFLPHEAQLQSSSGPPRSSMMDDLCFYLENHEAILQIDRPEAVEFLAKKIIASHYMQHMEFTNMAISHSQWVMSRHNNIDSLGAFNVEAQWSDVQALGRRITECAEDLEWIMLQCRIPLENPDTSRTTSWRDSTLDYQFLYMRYGSLRTRAESLNSSIAALVGMSGNQHSLREAKRTRALTVVGLMFIPLAYVASLFSMADGYLPGHSRFWLYFAVSLPLMVVMFGIYGFVDRDILGLATMLETWRKSV